MKRIQDLDVKEKKVLVRCDFDVPLDERGCVLDDFRIQQAIPTIKYLIDKKAKVILIGHAGRPKGKAVELLRLTPIQKKLRELLSIPVVKSSDCVGPEVERIIKGIRPGEVLLLENLRFHQEEEENDEEFARKLAKLGDIYINNAFANSHRDHASMTGIPKYLPAAAGFTLLKEIEILSGLIKKPKRPLVAIIGGAKVETTKLNVINIFSEIGDWVLIGDLIEKGIKEQGIVLNYPQKIITPFEASDGAKDINSKTITLFKEKIFKAKTIFWNGPLGQIEKEEFSRGSKEIADAIIASNAFSVVGGGDTIGFINQLGLIDKFNYVSTGGGAMMEFLSGKKLPGIIALELGISS